MMRSREQERQIDAHVYAIEQAKDVAGIERALGLDLLRDGQNHQEVICMPG